LTIVKYLSTGLLKAKVIVIDFASILIDRVAVRFGLGIVTLIVSTFYLRRLHHNAAN
jgi:hypothetical protein